MSDGSAGRVAAPRQGAVDVFDWDIAPIGMAAAVAELRRPADHPRLVMTVNVAIMWMASRDPELDRIVRSAHVRVADGMGVIWAWRALGRRLPERVAGIDLMTELMAAAATDGRSVYLLSARPEVLDRLVAVLGSRFPALRIAGRRDGYFGPAEEAAVVADVAASGADVVFIGMPSPAKERFAADHLDELGADLVIGVGGSFDVVAGYVPRAPAILQRIGLEWAWRLACEPRRMWRRYAVTNVWLASEVARRRRPGRSRRSELRPTGPADQPV